MTMENLGKSAGHEEGAPALNERGPSEPYALKKHLSTPPQGGPNKKAILRADAQGHLCRCCGADFCFYLIIILAFT